jgi:hypothetical protein
LTLPRIVRLNLDLRDHLLEVAADSTDHTDEAVMVVDLVAAWLLAVVVADARSTSPTFVSSIPLN